MSTGVLYWYSAQRSFLALLNASKYRLDPNIAPAFAMRLSRPNMSMYGAK